jgi:hypothetical protein
MRLLSEIYVARNEKKEIRIYRLWWLNTKEECLTRQCNAHFTTKFFFAYLTGIQMKWHLKLES